ncbi:DUF924 family protein [Dyella telluris]|uniref:DUF924 domain-containing protein n=1 Tax=Dyella telluris TaxID=2763498 RepID=A0A7G8PZF1_9GAMM|nr:DUF924 family protein [Dyella telluris]QNJ99908.1 DUF924 domain-containing protein [Dyella telluris]
MISTPADVLDFWFEPATEAHWFARSHAFDDAVRERFGATLEAARRGDLDAWANTPEGWLALLIVRDQFSRNVYRNDHRAWSTDAGTQAIALAGIARGYDQALSPLQRLFAYLPLEHAEDLALQQHCVSLFERLAAEQPEAARARFKDFLDYARQHHDVIKRFGRFPHRNAVLGRADTPAEQAYLSTPGTGF